MAEQFTPHGSLTVEEYLKMEETATVKHEYVAGTIHAHAGASSRHNLIAGNIFAGLWNAARGGSCRVYGSDMRLRAAEDTFYYPDVMVVCGDNEAGDGALYQDAPCLVVEVTSPSTEQIDRREKVAAYRKIPTLKAYLVVAQDRRWIERHWLADDGEWRQGGMADEGSIPVPCPETRLSLDDVYEGL
ncbi:MAG TPA: Uma2 family endonuclease [Rubrobacteraceae bacterium]|nr:Uma2 family endonuclease [Rubrobacteraceae bacterium]